MSSYQLDYASEVKTTLEAMKLAGRFVFKGPKSLLLWAQTLALALLVPAGFLAVVLIVKILVTGSGSFAQPLWLPAVFLLGGVLSLWLAQKTYVVMAQASVTSRFGRMVRVSITPEAFVFAGGRSAWQMDWGDIDGVLRGPKVIAVCTGAVALPVSMSAFESPQVASEAFDDMTRWHKEAMS